MFRSLLVPLDLSAMSERTLERVGHVRLARDARVTLLHVVPQRLAAATRRMAADDARRALAAAARVVRRSHRRVQVETVVRTGNVATEIGKQVRASGADLVVMGRGGPRALRDVFLGSTAERVLRRAQRPVLVVRGVAHTPYRRPLVAVDTGWPLAPVLEVALGVASDAPELTFVHAFDVPFEGLVYPSLDPEKAQQYREHYKDSAHRAVGEQLAEAGAALERAGHGPLPPLRPLVRHGSARQVVPRAVASKRSDLLVLGSHAYTGVSYALLGSVAGDLLRSVPCDALVVPPVAPRARKR